MAFAASLVGYMLAVVLDQRLKFGTASVQDACEIERNVGIMVGVGAAELV